MKKLTILLVVLMVFSMTGLVSASSFVSTGDERIDLIPTRQLVPSRNYKLKVEFSVMRHVPGTYSHQRMEYYQFEGELHFLDLPENEDLETIPTVISYNQRYLHYEVTLNVGAETHDMFEGMRVVIMRQLYVPGAEQIFLMRIGEGVVKYVGKRTTTLEVIYKEDRPRIGDKAFRLSP